MSRSSSADSRLLRSLRWLPGLLLGGLLLAHAGGHLTLGPIRQLDNIAHDARLRLFARESVDERLAIVAIDEASLAELGRWPWSRDRLAELLRSIFHDHGAVLVGLDVILAEPDRSSGLAVLDELAQGALRHHSGFQAALAERRADLDLDGRLAAELKEHRVVLGFHLSAGAGGVSSGVLPPPLLPATDAGPLAVFGGYGGNLASFQAAAVGGGFLNAQVDRDGVRRRAPLLAVYDGKIHGAFALAVARGLLDDAALTFRRRAAGGGIESVDIAARNGTLRIPVGAEAQVNLPYPGRTALTRTYSAADVLARRVAPGVLRGRAVLLGATAPGLADLHATPVAEQMAGVHAHAALVSAILDGRVPHQPVWSPAAEAATLLGVLLALAPMAGLALPAATLLAAVVAAVLVGLNFAAWAWGGLALPLAGPAVLVAGLFGWRVFHGHFLEARSRRRLAALFGQYVPPELVERMSLDPARYDMKGRAAELTVLFADIRGFTALSESLPPDELALLMNEFLSEITDIVRAHGGTLDKYVGDAVMAFWGAPLADPAHARRAVEAACAMHAALPRLNARFAGRGWPPLRLGIGVNTGAMVVGDLGSRHRRAYTVLGDAVNVAARLQEQCAPYAARIVIGQATRAAIGDTWPCRAIGTVTLRGRQAPTTMYEPLIAASPTADTSETPDSALPRSG